MGALTALAKAAQAAKALKVAEEAKALRKAAPQDEALRLAQQRAALPPAQGGLGLPANNTPMQRAEAGKFVIPAYHGGDPNIKKFMPKGGKDNSEKTLEWYRQRVKNNEPVGYMDFRSGSFFSPATNIASEYAKEGAVYPVLIKSEMPLDLEIGGEKTKLKGNKPTSTIDALRLYRDGNLDEISIMDPDQVRSVFAAFDPWRKDAATAAAFGVAAPDLLAKEQNKSAGGDVHMAGGGALKALGALGKAAKNLATSDAAYNLANKVAEVTGAAPMQIMIGPKAKTYRHDDAALAAQMEKEGKSRADIWQATKTVRTPDNQLKQELSDLNMRYSASPVRSRQYETDRKRYSQAIDKATTDEELQAAQKYYEKQRSNNSLNFIGKANEFIEHPELFAAYPELANYVFRELEPTHSKFTAPQNAYGFYSPGQQSITVNTDAPYKRSTALHELQHAIQEIEGWQGGSSPEEMAAKMAELGHLKDMKKETEALLVGADPASIARQEAAQKLKEIEERLAKKQQLEGETDPYDAYRKVSGEEEARMVQARRDYPEEKLAERPPFMDYEAKPWEHITEFAAGGDVHMAGGGGLKVLGALANAAKRVNRVADYVDKPAHNLQDWEWKPLSVPAAIVNATEVPDYIQKGYGDFMIKQAGRAAKGDLTKRDLIKAYGITQSSIGRQGRTHSTATKAGLQVPSTAGLVRPEGAFAEWLASPMGQRYLNEAELGNTDLHAINDIVQKFTPFGKHNELGKALVYGADVLGRDPRDINAMIAGDKEAFRDYAKSIHGIDQAKAGFIGSLLGRGDLPTLDARQLSLHTNPPTTVKAVGSIMNRQKGKGAKEAVDRLIDRQEAMALDIDPSLDPFYQHLTHHTAWDRALNEVTTHDDLIRAMQNYNEGGEVHAAGGGLIDLIRGAKDLSALAKRTDRIAESLVKGGMSEEKAFNQARNMAAQTILEEKYMPPEHPTAPALSSKEIIEHAERMAKQVNGEYVNKEQAGRETTGKSQRQFNREKNLKADVRQKVAQPEPETVDYSKHLGSMIVGVPGDATLGGLIRLPDGTVMGTHELHGVGRRSLDTPIQLYGGPHYGLGHENSFWASNEGPAQGIQNLIRQLGEDYPVLGQYVKMGPGSEAFAMHNLEALMGILRPEQMSRAKREALAEHVNAFRGKDWDKPKKDKPRSPDFVGFKDPDALLAQAKEQSDLRKVLAQLLSGSNEGRSKMAAFGLPSGSDVVTAITHPELRNIEQGASGFAIGKMDPTSGLTEGFHPTYEKDIPGQFIGRSAHPIPYDLAFPDTSAYLKYRQTYLPEDTGHFPLFKMQMGRQKVTDQYVNQIDEYLRRMKQLTGRKKGGEVEKDE